MRYLIVFFTFLLSVTFYGQNDYSMSFDGVDSEVILSDITMSQSFSFESYLFISSSTDFSQADAGRHIFSTGANNSTWASFAFGISDETLGVTQPTIVCELGSPSSNQFVATQSFPLDVWVHIGITFDNGQLEVYQNGVNILSNSTGISVSTNAFNSRIGNRGADWGNSQYQFEGNISHLSYWDITLSQTEIHQYMNCPPSGEEESLVGYWNFEEGSGTTAFDQTTNGNDGAINGATYSTDVPEQNCSSDPEDDSVIVLSPNGSECFSYGDSILISWSGGFNNTGVDLRKDGTQIFDIAGDVGSANSVLWIVSEDLEAGSDYQVRVYDAGPLEENDWSDGFFSITPLVDLGEDITTCDESVTLDAGEGYDSYLWSNGETTQSIEVSESGDYSVEVGNGNNSSLSFDGVDDYVDCGSNINIANQSFTLGSWIRYDGVDALTGDAIIMSAGTGLANQGLYFGFYDNPGSPDYLFMNFHDAEADITSYNPLNIQGDGLWHHIAASYDSLTGERFLYFDGNIVGNDSTTSTFQSVNTDFALGITSWNSVDDYQGLIDDAYVYNKVLSQQEIQNYMFCPPSGDEEGLVGYWNFEEGSGATVYDLSENGNDGTINGATWSDETPVQNCSSCSSSDDITVTINVCGCTDDQACNFNENAVEDDGSCEYITPVDLGEDITTCDESVTLDAGEGYDSYLWSNGETTQSIEVSESGDYSVEVGNGNNSSLSFDGQNDYVQLGSSNLLPSNAITISTWFNSSGATLGTDDIFVSDLSWSTYTIRMGDQGNLGWRIQPNAGSPGDVTVIETFGNGVNYSDDNWHYISCTWDGSNMNMFIDGIQIPSNPIPTSFSSVGFTNDNATIGSYPTTNEEFFHGQLDNFEIWNTALSQSQIQNYMNCPPTGNEEGLVGYWNFDDGIGETAFDQTGNGNDGVVNGATWSTETPEQSCSFCSSTDEIGVTINVCGCTDSEAVNYNIDANEDDSSCCYDIDYVNDTYDEGYSDGVDSVICP